MEEVLDSPLSFNPHEDIGACTNALQSIDQFDKAMLDDEEREMINEIKRMSLYIIHIGIKEIFTANFYGEETDTQHSPS